MSAATATAPGCSRCESPLEEGDLRCSVCALPVPAAVVRVDKIRTQILRCTECGAAIAFDANKQAPACGFCGATMKVEQPVDPIEVAQLQVPFAVPKDLAQAALRTWLGRRGFFAPKTLKDEAVFESLTPLCWAAWVVNATAEVAWTADSDAGSQRSDWAPHAGVIRETFGNIVIPASRGLTAGECSLLGPYYDLSQVVGVSASAEPSMIESFDAQRSAARQQVARAIEAVSKNRVEKIVPGRRTRNIHVSCLVQSQTTDRIALPAWVLAYRYRGSPYRAIVHGQRPEAVFGSSPTDWGKVLLVVGGAIALAIAIIALILYLTQR
jgi:ribosomal protein S27AE